MDAARTLRRARLEAGLTQRDLAGRAGIKQPAIARIERREVVPRLDTLDRLLESCGRDLELSPRLGQGVERTVIRELLKLSPLQRLALAVEEANKLDRLEARRIR